MRTLVLGDLHLSTHAPRGAKADLVALLEAHRGARIVFAGDFFDLSAEVSSSLRRREAFASQSRSVSAGFSAHASVAQALAEHVEREGEIVWLSGNHDCEIGEDASVIARALRLSPAAAARVKTTPWFYKQGGLHVEHGHLYAPDNAPPHPLASSRGTLGVHFVEEFIAKTGAFAYLNANDDTPLRLLVSAFRWYGTRAPQVVYRYFRAAFAALGKSGRFYDGARDAARAEAGLEDFLASSGLDEETARALMAERATPTMSSMQATIARLYLDRVAATVALLAGMSAFALGKRRLALLLGAAGLGGLAWSWSRGHDRYGGKVPTRLDDAARRVARAAGASLVVFGHAHEIADREGYSNTASFAFPRGGGKRPYLEIEGSRDNPHAVRRFW
jgi:UDP-2,3-diacylglucosamine pyrophosphatase LpxH